MRTRVTQSIPFWLLIVASIAAGGVGAWLLNTHLGTMAATLTDGTATGVEVYVGQIWAVLGAILAGAGAIGILLALAVATAVTTRPTTVVESAATEAPEADAVDDADAVETSTPATRREAAEAAEATASTEVLDAYATRR